MLSSSRKPCRSASGVVAGVCSGLAEYLSVDVGVLRFAVVAVTLVTGGSFALVYAALWLILPEESQVPSTVDVKPDSVSSETYESVGKSARERRKAAREAAVHTPPSPPAGPDSEVFHHPANTQAPAALGTVLGTVLVVIGFAFLASFLIPIFTPFQFWPLFLIAFGIIRMVLPGNDGYRMDAFVWGALFLFMGVMLILQTTGVMILALDLWIGQGWPVLMIAAGCMVLWKATDLNGFAMAALAMVVAFCVIGILFCSAPGPAQHIFMGLPFSKGLMLPRGW